MFDSPSALAGPSSAYMPPTPPVQDDADSAHYSAPRRPARRLPPGRRPASSHPTVPDHPLPVRKFTDPAAHASRFGDQLKRLNIDMDSFSMAYDEACPPTLSFVTTSTVDSTASTPSLGTNDLAAFPTGLEKPEVEVQPRVRVRTNTGRQNAYSSAESSTASGAYYGYPDLYTHVPPVPVVPNSYAEPIGLGLAPRAWPRSAGRFRSDSASSSITTASVTTTSEAGDFAYPYAQHWAASRTQPEAVALVHAGRENLLDVNRLEALGGIGALGSDVTQFAGVTHLLLPAVGSIILDLLPALFDVLAPTLVVADISYNDLTLLPEALAQCSALEELNVSGNSLHTLPPFLGELRSLHMLVADDCSLLSLPGELANAASIHTLCLRRNRLVALPAWLCMLARLETLRVDDNPFAAQWSGIVAPILANAPAIPPRSSSARSLDQAPSRSVSTHSLASSLSSARDAAGVLELSPASPLNGGFTLAPLNPIAEDHSPHVDPVSEFGEPQTAPLAAADELQSRSIRKMRSAGALLGKSAPSRAPNRDFSDSSTRSVLASSASSRFASLSGSGGRRAASAMGSYNDEQDDNAPAASNASRSGQKSGKWGFFRKMSMSRLQSGDKVPSLAASASANITLMPPPMTHNHSDPVHTLHEPKRPTLPAVRSAMTLPTRRGIDTPPSSAGLPHVASVFGANGNGAVRGKRRSFLPVDASGPPALDVSIPAISPFLPATAAFEPPKVEAPARHSRHAAGLDSIKSYLRDLYDLSRPPIEPYGGFEVVNTPETFERPTSPPESSAPVSEVRRARRGTLDSEVASRKASLIAEGMPLPEEDLAPPAGKRFKNDRSKRARVIREIVETERTYVRGLDELVSLYVKPASQPVHPGKGGETVVPLAERKVVFGGVESILAIHRDNFLPALEKAVAPLLAADADDDGVDGALSMITAHAVGEVFRTYIAYMKQYSTYINNFDNALSRMKGWTALSSPLTPASSRLGSPSISAGLSAAAAIGTSSVDMPHSGSYLSPSQRKRVKTFLKRCRESPKHSQINLESYLLLPVQRVPRYKLLLEDLAMCTPPRDDSPSDALDDALAEIANLASLMNEEKREAESRLRLFHWQQRITSRGPSPLVQPHRRLILDGPLTLIRLVKKQSSFVEVESAAASPRLDADQTVVLRKAVVPVEHIRPEPMDRPMTLVLCSDLLVLVQPRTGDRDGQVDLFSVLRMATLREPASVVSGNVLRVVDNKSIYYFSAPSTSTVVQWCRAINQQSRR
ncbi:hypothetical protein Q5752_004758 [Cryptotrichosporon argae]